MQNEIHGQSGTHCSGSNDTNSFIQDTLFLSVVERTAQQSPVQDCASARRKRDTVVSHSPVNVACSIILALTRSQWESLSTRKATSLAGIPFVRSASVTRLLAV